MYDLANCTGAGTALALLCYSLCTVLILPWDCLWHCLVFARSAGSALPSLMQGHAMPVINAHVFSSTTIAFKSLEQTTTRISTFYIACIAHDNLLKR